MVCSECYDGMECQHCWERRIVREREAARAEVAKLRELLHDAFSALAFDGYRAYNLPLCERIEAALKVEV